MITSQPSFVMAVGITPPWTSRDPRSQLTNAGQMAWQQTHPSLTSFGPAYPRPAARFRVLARRGR
jgi:hypothetical protein